MRIGDPIRLFFVFKNIGIPAFAIEYASGV
jgi:hypothetical protein